MDISDNICNSIYKSCIRVVDSVVISNPEMRLIANHEFENFILHLNSKIGKIQNYLNLELPTKDKIIKSNAPNFIFELTIHPDKSSEFKVTYKSYASRNFDPSYLLSKVRIKRGYVYFIKSEFGYKIGCTSNIEKRLKIFEVKLPFRINLESFIECKDHNKLESMLHGLLSHKRIDGEWFDLCDSDFIDIDKVVNNIGLNRIVYG